MEAKIIKNIINTRLKRIETLAHEILMDADAEFHEEIIVASAETLELIRELKDLMKEDS